MNAIVIKEANFLFTKPKGWSDDECSDLAVFKGKDGKHDVIISAWQPSAEDIERINNGLPVYLTIVGTGMPPVSLSTETQFSADEPQIRATYPFLVKGAPGYCREFIDCARIMGWKVDDTVIDALDMFMPDEIVGLVFDQMHVQKSGDSSIEINYRYSLPLLREQAFTHLENRTLYLAAQVTETK